MKKRFFYFGYLMTTLGALITLSSCGSEEYPEDLLNKDIKDFCIFQQGSFWVYGSENAVTDSFYLKLHEYANDFDHEDKRNKEGARMLLLSSRNINDDYYIGATTQFAIDGGKTSVCEEYFGITPFSAHITFFSRDDNSSLREGDKLKLVGDHTTTLTSILDSMSVRGNIYTNVREFTLTSSLPVYHKKTYWARNYGRICYIDQDDNRWELISSKIIQ